MGMTIICVILLSTIGCKKEIELTHEDNETTISIDVGETLKVILYAPNSPPPYSWQNVTTGETVVQVRADVRIRTPFTIK
jgi:hypothetical protein